MWRQTVFSLKKTGPLYPTGSYGHVSMILSAKIEQNPGYYIDTMIVSGNLAKNQRYYLVGIILSLILETAANFVFGIGQLFITSFTNIRRFCGCGTGQSANRTKVVLLNHTSR